MSNFNTQLVIEGLYIDLSDNFDGAITYTINNVKDISTITSNYSKTITVPGTSANNEAFSFVYDIKTSNDNTTGSLPNIGANFNFKRKARAYILQDQQVILQGYAQLISASTIKGVISYQLQIFSDLTSLVYDLGDGRLEDLFNSGSSTPYDHQLTLANITGSWNQSSSDAANAAGLPFVYPLIDYGDYDTLSGVNFYTETLRPALYAKTYFDLCMASASYTYSSSFLSGSYFQGMVIPYKDAQISGLSTNLVFSEALNTASLNITSSNTFNSSPDFIFNQTNLPFYTGSKFTPAQGASYNFTVNLDFDLSLKSTAFSGSGLYFYNTPINIYAYIPLYDAVSNSLVNGGNYITYTIPENTFQTTHATSTFTNVTVSIPGSVFVPVGQYAKIGVSVGCTHPANTFIGVALFPSGNEYQPGSGSIFIHNVSATNVTIDFNSTLDGNNILFNQLVLKDIKQIDFVTSIFQLFDLYPVVDKNQPKHFLIKGYDEFYQNNLPVLDWTNKIDTDQEIKVTPLPQLTSQNILLSYRGDSDWYNQLYSSLYGNGVYGQLQINSGFSFNKNQLDVLNNCIFSPTVPVQYQNEYLPCETTIEILNASRNTIQASGYYSQVSGSSISASAASIGLSTSNTFTKAREGGYVSYWGKLFQIKKVINQSQFIVANLDGTDVALTRPAQGQDTTYYSKTDTFSYIGDNNKIFPAIYSTSDLNVTRQPVKVNPRILYYQGLKPCNNWRLQYTPQASATSLTSSYFNTASYYVTQSVYPCVSHLDDYSNPTKDLLFSIPNEVFFPAPNNYPTGNLFTNNWRNSILEITDEDAKMMTANLKLSSIDVANLDLSQKVCIDGTYFRINSITDYTPDDSTSTKVELIRTPFQIYNPQSTGSAFISFLFAGMANGISSGINNITVNGISPSMVTGSSYPLTTGETALYSLNPTASGNVVITVSSSVQSDTLSIADGFNSYNFVLSSGSSTVSASMTFLNGNEVTVNVNPRVTCTPSVTAGNNGPISEPTVETVNLSGTAEGCNFSTITSSIWTFISGPSTPSITNPSSLNTTATVLNHTGSYIFKLSATDNFGETNTATTTVSVLADPPVPTVIVTNSTSNGVISGISNIAGFTSTTVPASSSISGSHTGFTNTIGVTFSTANRTSTTLLLLKNGSLVQGIPMGANVSTPQNFASTTFSLSDEIEIVWST